MESITIQLTKKEYENLQKLATKYRLSVAELARLSLEDFLSAPDEETHHAMQYILEKNTELYRRLAN